MKKTLDEHIKMWEGERKVLDEKIRAATKVKWDRVTPQARFNCPERRDRNEARCPGCQYALPSVCESDGKHIYYFPGGVTSDHFAEQKAAIAYCIAWRTKRVTGACGCGGTAKCICGYSLEFCYQEKPHMCPFCGRECTMEYNKTMLDMPEFMKELK